MTLLLEYFAYHPLVKFIVLTNHSQTASSLDTFSLRKKKNKKVLCVIHSPCRNRFLSDADYKPLLVLKHTAMHQAAGSSPQSHLLSLYLCIASLQHPANHVGETASNLSTHLTACHYLAHFLPSDPYKYSASFFLGCSGLCPLWFLCLMYF